MFFYGNVGQYWLIYCNFHILVEFRANIGENQNLHKSFCHFLRSFKFFCEKTKSGEISKFLLHFLKVFHCSFPKISSRLLTFSLKSRDWDILCPIEILVWYSLFGVPLVVWFESTLNMRNVFDYILGRIAWVVGKFGGIWETLIIYFAITYKPRSVLT